MELKIEDLSLEEKIGQMIIVGIDGNKITERTRKLILKYKIGGIILYRKNFKSYEEMVNLIKDLKELNSQNKIPLFISIDQEGGRVNRMPKEFLNLPVENLIANKMGEEGVKKAASIISEILSKAGFNMNFAPVLDLKRFDTKAIGDRSFCKDYKKVSKYGLIQINEYKAKNIIAVAKHFPGHGATKGDSHFMLPRIKLGMGTLENEDIISDDLKMKAIRYRYGTVNALVKSFEAGNDISIMRFNEKNEEKAILKIYEMVNCGILNKYRINMSVKRIINIKEKYGIKDSIDYDGKIDIEEINKRINEIRKICLN